MESSEIEFITIGEILAPWGNRGKLKVRLITDFPQRFSPSSTIYINRQPATVDSVEWRKGKVIIKLSTINSLDAAQKLRGQPVEISASQIYTLPEGQYYHFQLIGLEVWTTQGELLGTIADILTADSNDNYIEQHEKVNDHGADSARYALHGWRKDNKVAQSHFFIRPKR